MHRYSNKFLGLLEKGLRFQKLAVEEIHDKAIYPMKSIYETKSRNA
jgi:hypothetical protein